MQQHRLHLVLCRLPIQHIREQFSECFQCLFTRHLIWHITLLPSEPYLYHSWRSIILSNITISRPWEKMDLLLSDPLQSLHESSLLTGTPSYDSRPDMACILTTRHSPQWSHCA